MLIRDERSKYMDERNNDVHPQILNAHPRISCDGENLCYSQYIKQERRC